MDYEFRWNRWNLDHVARHGVEPREAEAVVREARQPYPRRIGDGKYLVRGQAGGGYFQVIYIFSPQTVVYVIHARPLTEREKRQLRRSRR